MIQWIVIFSVCCHWNVYLMEGGKTKRVFRELRGAVSNLGSTNG